MSAAGRGGCSSRGSQSSPLLSGSLESPPNVGLAAVSTWGNSSRNTQGKGKTKKQTGLAMHRKYSHPQGLLRSWGRGDKPSLRRHCSQRAFPTQPFGGPKPDNPLLWDTAKKRCIPIVPLGGRQRWNTMTSISCVLAAFCLDVFLVRSGVSLSSGHLEVSDERSSNEWSLCS